MMLGGMLAPVSAEALIAASEPAPFMRPAFNPYLPAASQEAVPGKAATEQNVKKNVAKKHSAKKLGAKKLGARKKSVLTKARAKSPRATRAASAGGSGVRLKSAMALTTAPVAPRNPYLPEPSPAMPMMVASLAAAPSPAVPVALSRDTHAAAPVVSYTPAQASPAVARPSGNPYLEHVTQAASAAPNLPAMPKMPAFSLPHLPVFEESILPKVKTVYPTGEKPLVVVSYKCPTELVGISTPSTILLREALNGGMDLMNRSNLLAFNMQQVCQ